MFDNQFSTKIALATVSLLLNLNIEHCVLIICHSVLPSILQPFWYAVSQLFLPQY